MAENPYLLCDNCCISSSVIVKKKRMVTKMTSQHKRFTDVSTVSWISRLSQDKYVNT